MALSNPHLSLLICKGAFLSDRRNSLALKSLLIQAVEAMTHACQHLLEKTKGSACSTYVDCILEAGGHGRISTTSANRLRKFADLRNNLVHRCWVIDDAELSTFATILSATCRTSPQR